MRRLLSFYFLFFVGIFSPLFSGPIFHIQSIQEFKDYVQNIIPTVDDLHDIAVIFDIDGTIHTAEGEFGGDEWFCHEMSLRYAEGDDFKGALDHVLPRYHEAQKVISVKPTEQEVVDFIHDLQKRECIVFALTARGEAIASVTQKQLKSLGISFSQSCGFSNQKSADCFCFNGVVHCGTSDKGSVLVGVLNAINDERDGCMPKILFYLDDAQRHVESVNRAISTDYPAISFFGFRYGGVDHRRQNFCPIRAAEEKKCLIGE